MKRSASQGTHTPVVTGDISSVDTNGNGQVPIQEAKDAGFTVPIIFNTMKKHHSAEWCSSVHN